MQSFRKLISLFLLAAISLYIAPKDLLHELCEHEDTKDTIRADARAHHISKEHHHCDCLQLSSPPFYHSVGNFSFAFSELLSVHPVENVRDYHFSLSPFLFFRGPPSLV